MFVQSETTSEAKNASLAERAMIATGFGYCDDLWWRMSDENPQTLQVFIRCSDLFIWGCADVEQITEENIDLLEQTFAECEERFGKYRAKWAGALFGARVRKMRPQDAWYNRIIGTNSDEDVAWRALFDATGEKRAQDFGNPQERQEPREANPCGFGSGGYNPTCTRPKGHEGEHRPIAL